ncbi:hypothetical protein MRX96_044670 [Rhipicephalus microplus]
MEPRVNRLAGDCGCHKALATLWSQQFCNVPVGFQLIFHVVKAEERVDAVKVPVRIQQFRGITAAEVEHSVQYVVVRRVFLRENLSSMENCLWPGASCKAKIMELGSLS